jgi:hypothetical protein
VRRAGDGLRWLLLSEDYPRLLEWREAIAGNDGQLIPAGPLIAAAADELRHPFLELITELGRSLDSLAWWSSRVSERNTAVTQLFLHCCYLHVAEAEAQKARTCVVSDSREVLESLEEIARADGLLAEWAGRRPPLGRWTGSSARGLAHAARFLLAHLAHKVVAPPRIDPATLSRPLILSRTWPDEASFGKDRAFRDRYFPGLDDWLAARGASTLTIPVLANLPGTYRSAWRRLRVTNRRFLAPERYYRVSDYLFTLREAGRAAQMPGKSPMRLGRLDVSRLFAAERRRRVFDPGSLEVILSARLPLRLAESGLEPELMIDPFENMIPEKALILGMRRHLPRTKLVGFQHGALYPMLLCNFVTHGEAAFAPMPDRVVCNGDLFREILVREGLPADRAVAGPSLRYAHLWESHRDQDDRHAVVLVPLPLTMREAVELLVKVRLAFAHEEHVQVRLKPHPMSQPAPFLRIAQLERLPTNFTCVDGPMDAALAGAAVVLGIASSSLYEALAAGKPVVVVGRDAALDLNPLAWHEDLAAVFVEPEAIRAETARLLSLSPDELAAYRRRADQVLRSSFNPVTPEAMRVFVDGLVELPGPNRGSPQAPAGIRSRAADRGSLP